MGKRQRNLFTIVVKIIATIATALLTVIGADAINLT